MRKKEVKKQGKLHIKTGDEVIIIAGKEKGQTGVISKVLVSENRAIVKGRNIARKHLRPQQNQPGGIEDIEVPIHISNLMHVKPDGKATRIGRRIEDGKIVRYYKNGGETVK
jgi:large subunit ribosomal protein L24